MTAFVTFPGPFNCPGICSASSLSQPPHPSPPPPPLLPILFGDLAPRSDLWPLGSLSNHGAGDNTQSTRAQRKQHTVCVFVHMCVRISATLQPTSHTRILKLIVKWPLSFLSLPLLLSSPSGSLFPHADGLVICESILVSLLGEEETTVYDNHVQLLSSRTLTVRGYQMCRIHCHATASMFGP